MATSNATRIPIPRHPSDHCNGEGCRAPATVSFKVAITLLRFCDACAMWAGRQLVHAAQAPVATCSCGKSYNAHQFRKLEAPTRPGLLPAGGKVVEARQPSGIPGYQLALANCSCRSTIAAGMTAAGVLLPSEVWEGIEAAHDGADPAGLGPDDDDLLEGETGDLEDRMDAALRAADAQTEAVHDALEAQFQADAQADAAADLTQDPEACPGCFAKPGDGVTVGCSHPEGCGYWRSVNGPTPVRL